MNQFINFALLSTLLLSACGVMDKVAPGRDKIDYKKSRTVDTLEVPPDLSSGTINESPNSLEAASATWSEAAAPGTEDRKTVLPATPNVALARDGDQQWLVVQGTPEQVWPRVREFWAQQGLLVRMENPQLGIMETDWMENRADIPQGIIRNAIGKVLDAVYSAPTRDKFRVRLEQGGTPGETEVYLTHRGVEEVVKGSATDNTTYWQSRPNDPELEAEMLKRLMVYLGVEEEKARATMEQREQTPVLAELVSDREGTLLRVHQDYSRTWRRTGVALDRVGFTVEDRDRSNGVYYVRYNDPLGEQNKEGILSKLAFWSSDDDEDARPWRIELQADGAETRIIVRDSDGDRDTGSTAKRILTLLEEQLK